jgi:hypothetical protein
MIDRLLRLLALFTLLFAAVAAARTLGASMPLPMQLAYSEIKDTVAHIRLADAERSIIVTLLRLADADTQKAPLFAGWLDYKRLLFFSGGTERAYLAWTLEDGIQPLDDIPLTCRLLESRVSLRGDSVACTTFDQQSVMIQRRGEEAWQHRTETTITGIQFSHDERYLLLESIARWEQPQRVLEVMDVTTRQITFGYQAELALSGDATWLGNTHWLMFDCHTQRSIHPCLLDVGEQPPVATSLEARPVVEYYFRSANRLDYLVSTADTSGYGGDGGRPLLALHQDNDVLILYQTRNIDETLLGARWSPDGSRVLAVTETSSELNFLILNPQFPLQAWSIVRASRISAVWRPCPEAAC